MALQCCKNRFSFFCREIQQCKNDSDSRQLHKEGKPDGFHYSEHRTADSKHNVILDVYVTAANLHDVDALPKVLRRLKERLGHLPKYLGLDAGYHSAKTGHLLEIQGVIGYRRHTHKGEHFGKYASVMTRKQIRIFARRSNLLHFAR